MKLKESSLAFIFLFFAVTALIVTDAAIAQESNDLVYQNALYVELGGNALAYSLNYDHAFSDKVSGRIGSGFFGGHGDFVATPVIMLNHLLGKGYKRLELGAGLFIAAGDVSDDFDSVVGATFTFAYRYHKPNNVFFKAGFTPIIAEDVFLPWFGISVGYSLEQ